MARSRFNPPPAQSTRRQYHIEQEANLYLSGQFSNGLTGREYFKNLPPLVKAYVLNHPQIKANAVIKNKLLSFLSANEKNAVIIELANIVGNTQNGIDHARQLMRNNGLQMQQLHFQQQALQAEAKPEQSQLQQQINALAALNRPVQNDEQHLLQQKQIQTNTLASLVSSMADYELSALFKTYNVTPQPAAAIFASLQEGYTAPVTGVRRIARFIFGTAIDKDTKFKLLLDDSIPLAKKRAMFAAVPPAEQIKYLLRLNHEQEYILAKQFFNASANKNPPQAAAILMRIKQRFSKILDVVQLFKCLDNINTRKQIFNIVAAHEPNTAAQILHKDAVNTPQGRAILLSSIDLNAPNGKANSQFLFNGLDKNRGYSSSAKIEVLNLLAHNRLLQNILIVGLPCDEAAEVFTSRAIGVDLNQKLDLYKALAKSNPETAMQVIVTAKKKNGMIFTGANSHDFFREFANVHRNNIELLVRCLRQLQPDAAEYLNDVPCQQQIAVKSALQNPVAASASNSHRAQGYGSVLTNVSAMAARQPQLQTPAPTNSVAIVTTAPASAAAIPDNSRQNNKHATLSPSRHLDDKHSGGSNTTDVPNPVPPADNSKILLEDEKTREQAARSIRTLS